MQALKYAAYSSRFTPETLTDHYRTTRPGGGIGMTRMRHREGPLLMQQRSSGTPLMRAPSHETPHPRGGFTKSDGRGFSPCTRDLQAQGHTTRQRIP